MVTADTCGTSYSLEAVCRTLAHDLNNILSIILGNLSLAMGGCRNQEKFLKTLSKAEQAALKARELTHQLAIYARHETAEKTECEVPVLLREVVNQIPLSPATPVNLILPEDLFAIRGDLEQLKQAIRSLIVHFIQEMNSGGVINIETINVAIPEGSDLPVAPGTYVKIMISQQVGIGLETPWEPGEKTAAPKVGQSLWLLHTVYLLMEKLIANHGGHLSQTTTADGGLAFELYLPACRRESIAEPDVAQGEATAKSRILIVDDEEMVRANVEMILNFLGYEAESAGDGPQALELYRQAQARQRPFDAVLIDLTIRGELSGRETMGKLLQIDPQAKAIVFSGQVNDPVVLDFQSFGFKGLIKKPYTVEDFRTVLAAVVH